MFYNAWDLRGQQHVLPNSMQPRLEAGGFGGAPKATQPRIIYGGGTPTLVTAVYCGPHASRCQRAGANTLLNLLQLSALCLKQTTANRRKIEISNFRLLQELLCKFHSKCIELIDL